MRVIFLDFDGVINNCGSYDDYIYYPVVDKRGKIHNLPFSAQNIGPLKALFEFAFKNEIKFVLSTSWREVIAFSEINLAIKNFLGFNYLEEDIIIDETPSFYTNELHLRGLEIKKYLLDNLQVLDYLIIDDNFDFLDEQKNHILLLDSTKGFSEKDLKKVKKYFL